MSSYWWYLAEIFFTPIIFGATVWAYLIGDWTLLFICGSTFILNTISFVINFPSLLMEDR